MKPLFNYSRYTTIILLLVILLCCRAQPPESPDPPPPPPASFAKGADISWITEMEAAGRKFYNTAGVMKDGFQLMKDLGMNAIRLRVWVDPVAGGCDAVDVLAK